MPGALSLYPEMSTREIEEGINNVYKDLVDDKDRGEILEICKYWHGRCIEDRVMAAMPEDLKDYVRFSTDFNTACTSANFEFGGGPPLPNYEKLFQLGLNGILKQIEDRLNKLKISMNSLHPRDYVDQLESLEAMRISCKAMIRYAERYAEKAVEMAQNETDLQRKRELERIADSYSWAPVNPPRTLHEALQTYLLVYNVVYLIEFRSENDGSRWDLLFYPFYKNDLEKGRITREEAQELVECLLFMMEEMGVPKPREEHGLSGGGSLYQNVMLGGVTQDGEDACNEFTLIVLDAAMVVRNPLTNVVFRYHPKVNSDAVSKVIDCIRSGLGYPSLFNDSAVIPLIASYGIPLEEARGYTMHGCVEWLIPGKPQGLYTPNIGVINLGKCFELALNRGIDPFTGKQLGFPTTDPKAFASIEDIMQAYLAQVRFIAEKMVKIDNIGQDVMSRYVQRPFAKTLLDGSIENGDGWRCQTRRLGSSPHIVTTGSIDIADSLAAIKKFVFEDKSLTMEELLASLRNNFEEQEELRQRLINEAPKYGNDDDYVDHIAREVHHRTQKEVAQIVDYWGVNYTISGSIAGAYYPWGRKVGSLPNGRKAKQTFADGSLSPYPGYDHNGPTGVLKSMSKVPPVFAELTNQRFMPNFLEGDNKKLFAEYLRTWADLGNWHIQFNIADDRTLLDAQAHPEKYGDLIVRVAGYSAYFVDLSKGIQDEIIKRVTQRF